MDIYLVWLMGIVLGVWIGMILGYGLCTGDERRAREERLWMRLLYQHQLNMKKGIKV